MVDRCLPARSCTTVPTFVDTNVLIYAEDLDAGEKHRKACDLVVSLWEDAQGVVSVQVLQEFFVNVTRKLARPLSVDAATRIVEQYLTWRLVENTGALLLEGIQIADQARLSFRDGLIVAAAASADCEELLTEDLNDGQVIGGVRIVNPFR